MNKQLRGQGKMDKVFMNNFSIQGISNVSKAVSIRLKDLFCILCHHDLFSRNLLKLRPMLTLFSKGFNCFKLNHFHLHFDLARESNML